MKLGWDSASYEAAKAEVDRLSPRTLALKPMLALGGALAWNRSTAANRLNV